MNLRPSGSARSSRSPEEAPIDGEQLADMIGQRHHIDVTIPRTNIRAKMRIVTRSETSTVRADVRAYLLAIGFPADMAALTSPGAMEEWNSEFAVRTLALAVRDSHNVSHALACIEDWRECDDDQLAALWAQYQDLVAELDPMGANVGLSDADVKAIEDASKKKAVDRLMQFGSRKLALYVTTSAPPPSTSPTPTSSSS